MVTIALHFETGYLAVVPLVVWPFLVPSDLWRRLGRAVVVGGAALLASAWVVVPVLAQSQWAAKNQVLEGTGLENGYGAHQILDPGLARHRPDVRRRPPSGGDHPARRRDRRVHRPVATEHRRPRSRHDLVRHAPHDLRTHDLRWALRHPPREQRRVHPPLPDGRPTLRDPPRGGGGGLPRPMAARRRRPPVARGAQVASVATGRASPDQRCLRRRARDRARPGVDLLGHLRRTGQRAANVGLQAAADGATGTADRPADPLRARPPARPGVRRSADELGLVLHGRGGAGVQVPRERGHRRGRLHVADGVADDPIPSTTSTRRTPGDYPLFGIGYAIVPAGREPPVPAHRVGCSRAVLPVGVAPDGGFIHIYDPRRACCGRTGPTWEPRALPCSGPRCSKSIATWPSPSTAAGRPRPPPRGATASWGHRVMCWSSTPTWRTAKRAPWCMRAAPPRSC